MTRVMSEYNIQLDTGHLRDESLQAISCTDTNN